jgi:hypothetical protein
LDVGKPIVKESEDGLQFRGLMFGFATAEGAVIDVAADVMASATVSA